MAPRPKLVSLSLLIAALFACAEPPAPEMSNVQVAEPAPAKAPPAAVPPAAELSAWRHLASGEGDGLSFAPAGRSMVTLFCPAGEDRLLVNVASFRPVESEERMTFGSGPIAITLVANFEGDRERGGVSGEGEVPAELGSVVGAGDGISVNYGAQNAGPFEPVPSALAAAFLTGCRD